MLPFQGKTVLIDIWATWCAPCIEEFGSYDQINALTTERKDFVVLFISRDKMRDESSWRKFVTSQGLMGYHLMLTMTWKKN